MCLEINTFKQSKKKKQKNGEIARDLAHVFFKKLILNFEVFCLCPMRNEKKHDLFLLVRPYSVAQFRRRTGQWGPRR